MEYHPSKKHIKASIIPQKELQNIPDDIVIPFFIEYGSLYPYILYIFKRDNDELHFIEKDELEYLFENFFHHPTSFINHIPGSIFYEIQNKTSNIPIDLSGTCYDHTTILWFATPYEIYHTKKVFNTPFSHQVNDFFLDNPSLEYLYWDHKRQVSPIVAYSQNNLKKTIFQSTFGSEFSPTQPNFTLYKKIIDPLLPTVRYAVFTPYTEKDDVITFIRHIQHIPICYIHNLQFPLENDIYDMMDCPQFFLPLMNNSNNWFV